MSAKQIGLALPAKFEALFLKQNLNSASQVNPSCWFMFCLIGSASTPAGKIFGPHLVGRPPERAPDGSRRMGQSSMIANLCTA